MLAKDLEAGGVIAAKAGTKVEGQVTYTAVPSAAGRGRFHAPVIGKRTPQNRRDRTFRSEARHTKQAPASWNIIGWRIPAASPWSCMLPAI